MDSNIPARGRVVSLNISTGGVPKWAVPDAHLTADGVVGDRQRDLRHHGGPDRAVSLYSIERMRALQAEGHPITPGSTGENVTVEGIDWDRVTPGVRLRLGEALLEITGWAHPCKHIRPSFADGDSTRISQTLHPGWSRAYARVLREGTLRPGDPVELVAAE